LQYPRKKRLTATWSTSLFDAAGATTIVHSVFVQTSCQLLTGGHAPKSQVESIMVQSNMRKLLDKLRNLPCPTRKGCAPCAEFTAVCGVHSGLSNLQRQAASGLTPD
jgi:hypothetical protein